MTVSTGSGNGTLQVALHDDDRIHSVATGIALGGTGSGNGDVVGELYTLDRTAPTVTLDARPLVILAGSSPTYTLALMLSDNLAIQSSSLTSAAIRVNGPGAVELSVTLVSITPAGDGTPCRATFSVAGRGGSWTPAAAGTYQVTLLGGQVRDTAGNTVPAADLGSFTAGALFLVRMPLVVVTPP